MVGDYYETIEALKAEARRTESNAIIAMDIDITDLNGNGVLVSANGTAVYAYPIGYESAIKEELEKRREEKARQEKKKEVIRENVESLLAENEYTPVEQMIIQILLRDGEVSVMTMKKSLPRSVSPNDIQEALSRLETNGVIYLNESGNYTTDQI